MLSFTLSRIVPDTKRLRIESNYQSAHPRSLSPPVPYADSSLAPDLCSINTVNHDLKSNQTILCFHAAYELFEK